MSPRLLFVAVAAAALVCGLVGWMAGMPRTEGTVGRPVQVPAGSYIDASGNVVRSSPAPVTVTALSDIPQVDSAWIATTSVRTGVGPRALLAYARVAELISVSTPQCSLTWNMLAAVGLTESGNGTANGSVIGDDGELVGELIGPALDGSDGSVAVPDTDRGVLDHDSTWDHAVGPMQIVPSAWSQYAADGNGDGKADPNQIDDASLAVAHLMCSGNPDLRTAAGWEAALQADRISGSLAADVASHANSYAQEAR